MNSIVDVSVYNAITGSDIAELRIGSAERVCVLRHAVWQAMLKPKQRLRAKTRSYLVGTVILTKDDRILQDDLLLSDCGFGHAGRVAACLSAATSKVVDCKCRKDISDQLVQWLGLFADDKTLGALGSQRFQSIDEDGKTRPGNMWLDYLPVSSVSECFSFVQIQTEMALPEPRRPLNKRTKRVLELAFLKPIMEPQRLQRTWLDIASGILLGRQPPKGTSTLAIFQREPLGRWMDICSRLIVFIRDARGFYVFKCFAASGEINDAFACLRGGYNQEDIRALADQLQRRQQGRQQHSFDAVFDWLDKQLFPALTAKKRRASGLWEHFWQSAHDLDEHCNVFDEDPESEDSESQEKKRQKS